MQTDLKPKDDQSLWCGVDIPIIGLTGPKASGKTLFASTIRPSETLMIDCEMSSASYGGIPYKRRVDLFEELKSIGLEPTPVNAWAVVKEIVEKTEGIRVVVIDTWDFVQQGYVEDVEQHPERFKRSRAQYEKATGLLWADVKSSLHMWLGTQARRINGTIVLINHLGNVWEGGKPTSKQKAKGVDTIYQLASLYIRMDRSPDNNGKVPSVPAGFITEILGGKSRLVHTEVKSDGTVDLKPVLPPRIENCTPATIRQYILTPPNYDKLKKSELAPAEVMSSEQRLEIKAQMAADIKEAEQARLSRLELMRRAGQARAQAPTASAPAASANTTTTAAAVATEKPTAAVEAVTQAPVAAPAVETKSAEAPPSKEVPFDTSVTGKAEKSVFEVIEEQRRELKISDDQWAAVLKKDGVTKTVDLKPERAEEIRRKFWDRLTQRDLGKA